MNEGALFGDTVTQWEVSMDECVYVCLCRRHSKWCYTRLSDTDNAIVSKF